LLFALGGIDRFGTTLGDIGCAVELGALAAVPHPVQRNALSFQRGGCEFFRYDGVSATHPGESGRLRETAKFYRYFLRSFYLINGVRNVRVLYVGLVGSIVKDEGIIFQCIVHPFFQFGLANDRPRRVIGIAEV